LSNFSNSLLIDEVFRKYSRSWEDLTRRYIKNVWDMTKSFVKQALQYLTDDTVSDALLRYLLDSIMNNKLKLAHVKLEKLMTVHKEHSEIRNHYFTDIYNALQQ